MNRIYLTNICFSIDGSFDETIERVGRRGKCSTVLVGLSPATTRRDKDSVDCPVTKAECLPRRTHLLRPLDERELLLETRTRQRVAHEGWIGDLEAVIVVLAFAHVQARVLHLQHLLRFTRRRQLHRLERSALSTEDDGISGSKHHRCGGSTIVQGKCSTLDKHWSVCDTSTNVGARINKGYRVFSDMEAISYTLFYKC